MDSADISVAVENLFDVKPGSRTGKNRCGGTLKPNALQVFREMSRHDNSCVWKVIKGDNLTKNEKREIEASVFEDMQVNVPYSIKKKRRWETMETAENVLRNAAKECPSVIIGAAERYENTEEARSRVYGRLEPGSDEILMIKTRSLKGASIQTLEDSIDIKLGRKVKGKAKKQASRPHEKELTIVIRKAHESDKLASKGCFVRYSHFSHDRTGKYAEYLRQLEAEQGFDDDFDDSEGADDDDMLQVSSSVENRLNLADFVVEKSPFKREKDVRQQQFERVDEYMDGLLDESLLYQSSEERKKIVYKQQLLADSTFTELFIDFKKVHLRASYFFSELEGWIRKKAKDVNIVWIGEDKTQCLLDVSPVLDRCNLAAVIGFRIVQKNDCKVLKMVINTAFPCTFAEEYARSFENPPKTERAAYEYMFFKAIVRCLKDNHHAKWTQVVSPCGVDQLVHSVALYAPAVKSWTDHELLQKAAERARDDATSSSDNSFEVIKLNVCEYCGDEDPDNLVKLNCVHAFCEKCAKFAFTEQILSHSSPLTCPSCDRETDVFQLLFVLPIELIRASLRDFLDTSGTGTGTGECPGCRNTFQKVSGAESYRCLTCKIAFCQSCGRSPHAPLSCTQMKKWVDSDDCYRSIPAKTSDDDTYQRCQCGWFICCRPKGGFDRLECSNCKLSYYHYYGPDGPYTAWNSKKRCNVHLTPVGETVDANAAVLKKYGSKYVDARAALFDEKKHRLVRRRAQSLLGQDEAKKLMEIRCRALELLHFGLVWLHQERRHKHLEQWKEANTALNQLKSICDRFESQLMFQDQSSVAITRAKLERSVALVVSLF